MKAPSPLGISPVEDIVADMRAGRMVILVDEEDRENEGDLVLAAQHVSAEAINFMARFGRGLICLTLTRGICEKLELPPMTARNGDKKGTAFTVSIEAAEGVSTGISAADRARTVQAAVAANARPDDLVQPGHIFPLQAVDGGVLMRAGHTEAGCDLAAMAGCVPESRADKVDLAAMLRELGRREINELHVEAGARLNGSLLREGLVDELLVYLAPKLLGQGMEMAQFGPLSDLTQAVQLEFKSSAMVGADLRLLARLQGRDRFPGLD